MTISRTTHFYEFLARLRNSTTEEGGQASVLGMHLVQIERISDGATVLSERPLAPAAVDFAALAAAMTDVNLAAAAAAFAAEIEARA